MKDKNNIDAVISSYKPNIFWKDKIFVKKQLNIWSLEQIKNLIKRINEIEILVKKNSLSSNHFINNFIFEKLEISNN